MARTSGTRRRPAVHITLGRASRLHRLVTIVAQQGRSREDLLADLGVGLRTFYRELELLRRCGVKIRLRNKLYSLQVTPDEAEGRLPFPDPQLSFAEMAELSRGSSQAAKRLATLYQSVVSHSDQPPPAGRRGRRRKGA